MRHIVTRIVVSFVLVSCGQEREERVSAEEAGEQAVLERLLRTYYDDMSEGDWERYRRHFWEGATLTTAWRKPPDSAERVHVITIDAFIAQTPEGPDSQPVFSERMRGATIQVSGNLATAWVEYDAEFGRPDSLMRWSGTDVFSFLRNRGEWRIVSLVFESD